MDNNSQNKKNKIKANKIKTLALAGVLALTGASCSNEKNPKQDEEVFKAKVVHAEKDIKQDTNSNFPGKILGVYVTDSYNEKDIKQDTIKIKEVIYLNPGEALSDTVTIEELLAAKEARRKELHMTFNKKRAHELARHGNRLGCVMVDKDGKEVDRGVMELRLDDEGNIIGCKFISDSKEKNNKRNTEISEKKGKDSKPEIPQKPEKGSGVLPEKLRQKLVAQKLYRR